jgi:glutamate-1-semialdehyde 2,1-aminomutase
MEHLSPSGPVYQAGTLSGNPLAVAAGLKTLELLVTDENYRRLEALGQELEDGTNHLIRTHGLPLVFQRVGSMFCLYFRADPVRNFADATACDHDAFNRYFHGLLERGIYLAPSQYEAGFLGLAHTSREISATCEAASEILPALLR